jgi:hypothetical protein
MPPLSPEPCAPGGKPFPGISGPGAPWERQKGAKQPRNSPEMPVAGFPNCGRFAPETLLTKRGPQPGCLLPAWSGRATRKTWPSARVSRRLCCPCLRYRTVVSMAGWKPSFDGSGRPFPAESSHARMRPSTAYYHPRRFRRRPFIPRRTGPPPLHLFLDAARRCPSSIGGWGQFPHHTGCTCGANSPSIICRLCIIHQQLLLFTGCKQMPFGMA